MAIIVLSVLVNCILLDVVIWFQVRAIRRMVRHLWETRQARRPRRKSQSPHDCSDCQSGRIIGGPFQTDLRSYCEHKCCHGTKKSMSTGGFVCSNEACVYCGITDESTHALVGYGKDYGIQRLKCQACAKVVTIRGNTPLYYFKSDSKTSGLCCGFWLKRWYLDDSILHRSPRTLA